MANDKKRTPSIFVRDDGVLHAELKEVARITKIPMSQLVREGIIRHLAEMKQNHPRLREAA